MNKITPPTGFWVVALLAYPILPWAAMLCWGAVAPSLGLPTVSYWQAIMIRFTLTFLESVRPIEWRMKREINHAPRFLAMRDYLLGKKE